MATMQKSFEIGLSKGAFGESIVRNILEEKGYCVYNPTTEGAHAFDILAIKDKKNCIAIDVKSKARRNYFPDTGIDTRHYETYNSFAKKHNMQFWLFFVDEMERKIYGNELRLLSEDHLEYGRVYPLIQNRIIYFPLSKMKTVSILTQKDCDYLKSLNQRSYEYSVDN